MAMVLLILHSLLISLSSSTIPAFYGVSPDDRSLFSSDTITCRDSNKIVPIQKVNDDFCDCPDGTDEPGTSACPYGHFYCVNTNHKTFPRIFSSMVNDGICDCCDGSDEYLGLVACKNNCLATAKQSEETLSGVSGRAGDQFHQSDTPEKVDSFEAGMDFSSQKSDSSREAKEEWKERVENVLAEKEASKSREAFIFRMGMCLLLVEATLLAAMVSFVCRFQRLQKRRSMQRPSFHSRV